MILKKIDINQDKNAYAIINIGMMEVMNNASIVIILGHIFLIVYFFTFSKLCQNGNTKNDCTDCSESNHRYYSSN